MASSSTLDKDIKSVALGLGIHKHSDVYARDYWDISPEFAYRLQNLLELNDVVEVELYAPYAHKYKKDIVLTYNLLTALEILGLDWERYKQGFNNYDEMFEYVTSCKAFDKSKFALENLNHRNRVRDRKRKTYNLFLQYILKKPNSL